MRPVTILKAVGLVAFLTASIQAQEPLTHPAKSGAIRGLRVCIDPLSDGTTDNTLRASIYFGRLLRFAGAQVATTRFSLGTTDRIEARKKTVHAARADVLIHISGSKTAAVQYQPQDGDKIGVELNAKLATQLALALNTQVTTASQTLQRIPAVTLRLVSEGSEPYLAHRSSVHAAYQGLLAWWNGNKSEIIDLHKSIYGNLPTRATAPKLIAGIWPGAHPPETAADVQALIKTWRKSHTANPSQVYLDAKVTKSKTGWRLEGATELPMLARALRKLLKDAGVRPLTGRLRILPEEGKGSPYGRVIEAATTWTKPGRATGMSAADVSGQGEETQLLVGESVWILDQKSGYSLVHSASGYLGWARTAAIERVPKTTEPLSSTSPSPGDRVAETALSKLGIPYLYGGRSAFGIDCSGLSQTSWRREGVFLPRDARTQILAGELVATRRIPGMMRPGDLLFFLNASGKLSHVAVSLGGSRFVHATPPEVTVGSLDPEDPWYCEKAKSFVMAKRMAGR